MKIAGIRSLIVIVQIMLLIIQIVTGFKWMFIPVLLLTIVCLCLRKYEDNEV